jgi:hypothetical protein
VKLMNPRTLVRDLAEHLLLDYDCSEMWPCLSQTWMLRRTVVSASGAFAKFLRSNYLRRIGFVSQKHEF